MMKILKIFIFSILPFFANSQNPILDWTIHYETQIPDNSESVNSIHWLNDTLAVNASLQGDCTLDLNNQTVLLFGFNDNVGATIYYQADGSLLDFNAIASTGISDSYKKSDGSIMTVGGFSDSADFDFSSDELIFNSTSSVNGFLTYNDVDGHVNAISFGKFTIRNAAFFDSGHYAVATFLNESQIINLSDTLIINNNGIDGTETMILKFDSNNNLVDYFLNEAEGNNVNFGCSYSETLDELTVVGEGAGSPDYQWQGSESYIIYHNNEEEAFAVTYDADLAVNSFLRIVYEGNLNPYNSRFTTCAYDADGSLYVGGCIYGGASNLEINGASFPLNIDGLFGFVLLKLNRNKELVWIKSLPLADFGTMKKIRVDHNGFINLAGSFDESLEFPENGLTLNGATESGFIARWTPEGELIWAYTISDGGNNQVEDICITPNNEMYIGGWFTTYSTDFDFDENTSFDLGTTNGEDAFLAKYTISDPQADVFVEQGWQTTEATEGGASDVLYVRLSHAPASPVEVLVTPNAQIDLGNGAGNAITLNFAADATAIQQQVVNVTAFDDIVVEGAHTGNISFTINSPDGAFDVLTENSIAVAITDNDNIGISEPSQNLFSISPNPAEDILNVSFTQYQNNTVLHIYNESGQLVTTAKANGKSSAIDISKLAAGHYTIVMQNGSEKSNLVFVKM